MQAQDRAHRIGQTREVKIYNFSYWCGFGFKIILRAF